jgi:hypothetical protein
MQRAGRHVTLRSQAGAGPAADRPYVMRRKLLHYAAAASLLLLVATVTLWVRSYWVADRLDYVAPGKWFWCYSIRGTLAMMPSTARATGAGFIYDRAEDMDSTERALWRAKGNRWWERAGFYFRFQDLRSEWRLYLYFPFWFLTVATAILPAAAIIVQWRGARRGINGRCTCCGYDLRATPERCPECGAVPQRPAADA